jgi:hypothetical protein
MEERFIEYEEIEEAPGNKPKFGRLELVDQRNFEYPLKDVLRKAKRSVKLRTQRSWQARWWGDQGSSSMCTIFSMLHLLEHSPVTFPASKKHEKPLRNPRQMYCRAQNIDPWPGGCGATERKDAYDGTSVLAAVQVFEEEGFIESYHWEYNDVDNVVAAVRDHSPVLIGSNWYAKMNTPEFITGIIHPTGKLVGGHAYLIDGIDLRKASKDRAVRIFNSWGKGWGQQGRAYMSIDSLESLLKNHGEVCIVKERMKPR